MKIIPLEEFKKGINPYGISYGEMTKGKRVIVDIPVGNNKQMEVEGIITADFLGFDPFDKMKNNHNNWSGVLDIGWEKGFPDNLPVIIKDLKRILK